MVVSVRELIEEIVSCPYCGERIDIIVDPTVAQQNYIEDCQVCCNPIVFDVTVGEDDEVSVFVRSENE